MLLLFSSCFHFSPLFPADICIPISESVLSPHISPLDEHNKHSTKEHSWKKSGKMHTKHPLKSKICLSVIYNKKLQRKLCEVDVSFCIFYYNRVEGGLGSQSVGQQYSRAIESMNYVDICPSLNISMSRHLKHSMGSLKGTTILLVVLRLITAYSLALIHENVRVCPKELLLMTLSVYFSAVICTHQNHRPQP